MLQQEMAELVAKEAGHLRIGSIEPVASLRLPLLLVSFCRQYPNIRLTLESVTQVISRRVANGDLDLAICSPPKTKLGLSFEITWYSCFTRKKHTWSDSRFTYSNDTK